MKRALVFMVAALALTASLAGCATMTTQEMMAWQQKMSSTQPHCFDKRQCEAAWSAARNWVDANCGMKIQTMTDSYMETANSPNSSTNLACRVTKDPNPSGGYTLSITASCGNPFACAPDPHKAMLEFNQAVDATITQFAGQ
jgi:hypothetical protein